MPGDKTTIAILSPGAMGSAVAACLTASGYRVLTSLENRSPRSAERAAAAGMEAVDTAALARAPIIMSIVPPAEAAALAERLIPHIADIDRKPLYIDANALMPANKQALALRLASVAGCECVDGAILGPPPAPGRDATTLYVAGPRAAEALQFAAPGLKVKQLNGPVGAASALKMCFAGINKGVTGLGAAMLLAATRSGAAESLGEELAISRPDLLASFERQIPDMYGKAWRWIAEMREIAAFLDADPAAAMIFEGMARLYERLAQDNAAERAEVNALDAFLNQSGFS